MTRELGFALGLRPLYRVQVLSRAALYELRNDHYRGHNSRELPFLFFQRVLDDGKLLLRSPGGATVEILPWEACNVIPAQPIEVMAVPQGAFHAWSEWRRKPGTDMHAPHFKPGYLTHVMKDRWGRLDLAWVAFHDKAVNESWSFASPLSTEDHARVSDLMNRRRMPVLGPGASNASADHGVDQQVGKVHHAMRHFFQAALAGQEEKVSALASYDVNPLTTAAINRLRPGCNNDRVLGAQTQLRPMPTTTRTAHGQNS